MRRRLQMQNTLVSETNFRRAMENSMLTGMRAMDMNGRITYVNPAFCAMTGFSEPELVGRTPPFPYWPNPTARKRTSACSKQELQGRSPAGGIEVRVKRKDGDAVRFAHVRVAADRPRGHADRLDDVDDQHHRAKRMRDQLSASHERFTTVLEGLDAVGVGAVGAAKASCCSPTARTASGSAADMRGATRCWPATRPACPFIAEHRRLRRRQLRRPADAGADRSRLRFARDLRRAAAEVVRCPRTLPAMDRRSPGADADRDRHHGTPQRRGAGCQQQAEKAQVTSRLVTMGEMASSVAHELNQPLTAITNYCNGIITRVNNNAIEKQDLIAALEKTSKQAQRAGQIIHRIRAFVKRSEPQRVAAQAQDDRRRCGRAGRHRAAPPQCRDPHLCRAAPADVLMVDPILIEQVVLNLLKNAAEAIDNWRACRPRAATSSCASCRC